MFSTNSMQQKAGNFNGRLCFSKKLLGCLGLTFLFNTLSMNHIFTHVHLFVHGLCGDEKDKARLKSTLKIHVLLHSLFFLNFVMVLSVHVCYVIQNDVKINKIRHNLSTIYDSHILLIFVEMRSSCAFIFRKF